MGGELQQALPLLLMGIPAVLAGLLSLWLPETLGVKMPETMMDVGKRNMYVPLSVLLSLWLPASIPWSHATRAWRTFPPVSNQYLTTEANI